ncbi:MAG: ribonuclease III [Rickettsiaceae bacterium]
MTLPEKHIAELEKALNYKFKNLNFLKEALSHPSLKQHDPSARDYERLELLGDAILGFLITEMIFHNPVSYEEGDIAKIKAYVVSRDTIVKIAEKLKLADYIIMTTGEEKSGGRTNRNNIENAMEALLAAIYLDSDINQTRMIVDDLWSRYVKNIDLSSADPKSSLQELLQSQSHASPVYKVIKKDGAVHAPIFTVEVSATGHKQTATGKSIKEAEKAAARLLLQKLGKSESSKNI